MERIKEFLESKEFKSNIVIAILQRDLFAVKIRLYNELKKLSEIYNENIKNEWKNEITNKLKVCIYTDNIDTILQINCDCYQEIIGSVSFLRIYRLKIDNEGNVYLDNEYVGYVDEENYYQFKEKEERNQEINKRELEIAKKEILNILKRYNCVFYTDKINQLFIKKVGTTYEQGIKLLEV